MRTQSGFDTRARRRAHRRAGRARHGAGMAIASILLLVLALMAVLLMGLALNGAGGARGGGGAVGVGDNALRSASARLRSINAFNAAETGLSLTIQWLTTGTGNQPPADPAAFSPLLGLPDGKREGGYYVLKLPKENGATEAICRIRLYPGATNPSSVSKAYLIESVGECGEGTALQRCVLHAYVQQKSFAEYAFFEHCWNGGYWNSDERFFDGPVHINNANFGGSVTTNGTTRGENRVGLNWNETGNKNPIFWHRGRGAFTTSAPVIQWQKNKTTNGGWGDPEGQYLPNSDEAWKRVAVLGKDSIGWNQPQVAVPQNNDMQRAAVLGVFGTEPSTLAQAALDQETKAKLQTGPVGVALLNDISTQGGGVYVNGDVEQITLRVKGTTGADRNVQIYEVRQKNGANTRTSTVTIDLRQNQTTLSWSERDARGVVVTSGSDTKGGTTNGVLYVNGNVGDQTTGLGGISGDPANGGVAIADNYVSGGQIVKRAAFTIATAGNKSVNLNGDIKYLTPRKPDPVAGPGHEDPVTNERFYLPQNEDPGFTTNAGTLGVVSYNVKISDRGPSSATPNLPSGARVFIQDAAGNYLTSSGSITTDPSRYVQVTLSGDPRAFKTGRIKVPTNPADLLKTSYWQNRDNYQDIPAAERNRFIETQAAFFALNTYDVYGTNRGSTTDRHKNMGCYLHVNGGNTNGMRMMRLYDNRLANVPPPFFPTTGNYYQVLSWRRVADTLE